MEIKDRHLWHRHLRYKYLWHRLAHIISIRTITTGKCAIAFFV